MTHLCEASNSQRSKALTNYWTDILQQQDDDLDTFRTAIQNSMFLLPFDATLSPGGTAMTDIMTNSSSTLFPPPISCYPGLNSTQIERINSLETTVFRLDAASAASKFDDSCFPYRPVYGVVDLLGLRLPFADGREGVGLQAAALSNDAKLRAIIYSGEVLSALPGATSLPALLPSSTDPREFGTVDFMDHVLLTYFSSISNTSLATQIVSHVLSSASSSSPVPPANTSDIASALPSLPVIEFAVFGSVKPQDISASVSSFSTPSGELFFGSDAGQTFRDWALVNSSAEVIWTEQALSAEAVREGSDTNSDFESVWTPASKLVAQGTTSEDDVQKVVKSLDSLGLFSS